MRRTVKPQPAPACVAAALRAPSDGCHSESRLGRDEESLRRDSSFAEPVLNGSEGLAPNDSARGGPASAGRRQFLGTLGGAAATLVVGAAGLAPLAAPAAAGDDRPRHHGDEGGEGPPRARRSFKVRREAAEEELELGTPQHPSNGDEARYPDKCGNYSKALVHDSLGRVDLTSWQSFITALTTGDPADFENIILGDGRKQTDPQAGLAFNLEGTDSHQLAVRAAPAQASAENAGEMVELYWASLLRDVPFSHYGSNSLAIEAANELTHLSDFRGPKDSHGRVTTDLLFRGFTPGDAVGPYVSQFMVQPTFFGVQPISQQFVTYAPNLDYMADFSSYLTVRNGGSTGLNNQEDSQLRYMRDGRGAAAWTHVDVLYQGYFVALLVLISMGAPPNPGNPYAHSRTQAGFGTFGGPDFAATVGEVATPALKASWFQKWFVHRRTRPEETGGLVQLSQTGQGSSIACKLHSDVLNSLGARRSFQKYGSWLLSQTFPEGSPTHPSYPTGHGVVGGACITVLKFFFDGNFVIPNPVVPTADGLSLVPFTGPPLTVDGELNKLATNVSFGHGIHAGIHWRSDTIESMKLGEAVALSILRDKAQTCNKKFSVKITKLDGTIATISNSDE
jgi:hypothetical protein